MILREGLLTRESELSERRDLRPQLTPPNLVHTGPEIILGQLVLAPRMVPLELSEGLKMRTGSLFLAVELPERLPTRMQ